LNHYKSPSIYLPYLPYLETVLTGWIRVEEGHARLQQIGEHAVVEIAARSHADVHEEEAPAQGGNGADDDAERVDLHGVFRAEQTVRIQREYRREQAAVAHILRLAFGIRAAASSQAFQVCPEGNPVVISGSSDLTNHEQHQQEKQDDVAAAMLHVSFVHLAG